MKRRDGENSTCTNVTSRRYLAGLCMIAIRWHLRRPEAPHELNCTSYTCFAAQASSRLLSGRNARERPKSSLPHPPKWVIMFLIMLNCCYNQWYPHVGVPNWSCVRWTLSLSFVPINVRGCWINSSTVCQGVPQYKFRILAPLHGGHEVTETFVIVFCYLN